MSRLLRSAFLTITSEISTYQLFKYLALIYFIYLTIFLGYISQFALNDFDADSSSLVTGSETHHQIHLTKTEIAELPLVAAECHLQSDACFDVRQCSNRKRLRVFIYPDFSFGNQSRQFQEYIEAIYKSDYYEPGKTSLYLV